MSTANVFSGGNPSLPMPVSVFTWTETFLFHLLAPLTSASTGWRSTTVGMRSSEKTASISSGLPVRSPNTRMGRRTPAALSWRPSSMQLTPSMSARAFSATNLPTVSAPWP